MNRSPQQQLICDFVKAGNGSAIVVARAGTGKTTTLGMIAEETSPHELVVALAFNKQNAVTFQERFPKHVQSGTFHSRCLNALSRSLPHRPRVDGDKTFKVCKETWTSRDFERYYKFVSRLVGYAKNAGIGTSIMDNTPSEWFTLIDYYSLILDTDGDPETAVRMAMDVLAASNANIHSIDFDDMLYMALLKKITFDKANKLLLDEAQDTNGVQRALLHMMLAPGEYGRLIAVGDPAQSIYGFRGADSNAMQAIKTEFNCVEFQLSKSYRCSQNVIKEAQIIVPEIEFVETAPEGSVDRLTDYILDDFTSTDAILCRVTAPLVSLAFGFIRRSVGVRILGREIGAGLVSLVKKMNAANADALSEKLRYWRDKEVAKALARGHESAAAAIEDKVSCLNVFIHQLTVDESLNDLCRKIESLFSDNNKGLLTLCSVHKAKGLEWERVFILDRGLYMPSKWAKQEWQQLQEQNLIYVAITRAKVDLRYMKSDKWRQLQTVDDEEEDVEVDQQTRQSIIDNL